LGTDRIRLSREREEACQIFESSLRGLQAVILARKSSGQPAATCSRSLLFLIDLTLHSIFDISCFIRNPTTRSVFTRRSGSEFGDEASDRLRRSCDLCGSFMPRDRLCFDAGTEQYAGGITTGLGCQVLFRLPQRQSESGGFSWTTIDNAQFGTINSALDPRQSQFALKITF